ncbi:BLOC-1-related complex subunit 7 isoform X1 [Monodelphis domestica]|uniref:BLOC-1-related complex subunit 7 isoform X1 n=1 Tax=Monodelphis domestica TaxID=13616 RepID=UPI0024E1F77D|nr:BLOC-1-related complex subunit 7 isoform X1 [Monodelphis domestica]
MAAGAPESQSRFGHSVKGLLTEKVNACGTDVIALTKQVLKGSRSSELLGQAARNMVLQEDAILHSEDVRSVFFEELGCLRTASLCRCHEVDGYISVCVCFLFTEFKENGNYNHSSSVPVSTGSVPRPPDAASSLPFTSFSLLLGVSTISTCACACVCARTHV